MSSNRVPRHTVPVQYEPSVDAKRHLNPPSAGPFKVQIIRCDEICEEIHRFWVGLHRTDKQLQSPNFHPHFAKAVSRVRDDVEIAVFRTSGGHLAGIFPYQRLREFDAEPIGGRMNDYHGILLAPGIEVDLETLLHKLRIKRFSFHALSANQNLFEDYRFDVLPSYSIDVSEGYTRYMDLAKRKSRTLRRLPQKIRALQRDHGPLKFVFDCDLATVFDKLIELKSNKYVKSNTFDIFSVDWAVKLLRQIYQCRDAEFRGILSALWAGNSLAAAHFGMVAGNVLQYWFPVYDPTFSKYSPGLQLMVKTLQNASEEGIDTIDLSYGQSKFKSLFANQQHNVLLGQVRFNPLTYRIAKHKYGVRKALKDMPLKRPAKLVLRKIFPGFGRWHFK